MFGDALFVPRERSKATALALPLSALLHVVVASIIVILPLVRPGDLPRVDMTSVFVAPPPPAAPPAPPKGRGGKIAAREKIGTLRTARTFSPGILIVPVDIPDAIGPESLWGTGIEGGIEGGVDYGADSPWRDVFPDWMLMPVPGSDDTPVRAAGMIEPPRLVRRVEPSYPEIARQARVEGIVILEATTDTQGRVVKVEILRSIPLLDQAAIDAVMRWLYEPMVVGGRPRPVVFTVTVRFELK